MRNRTNGLAPRPAHRIVYGRPRVCATNECKTQLTAEYCTNNVFQFGQQKIVTRVHMMVPAETELVSLDVLDYMWEESYVAFSQPQ